jgi:NAD+ diphosphatase
MPTVGATTMLDRIALKRSDPEFVKSRLNAPGARFLLLADLKPVIRSNPERTTAKLAWFSLGELTEFGLPAADALFLGVDAAGNGHFALAVTEHRTRHVPGAIEKLRPIVDLRSLAMQGIMSPEELSLCGQARALAQWHDNARCCGHCGGNTLLKDGGWRRKCWACGMEWFPRTDPVVIMLVTDGERCLLAHEHRYGENMYSALAGFIEPGEDIEHAVRREVLEETSIRVGDVRYHSSQPWPFPHSLMIGCIARAESVRRNCRRPLVQPQGCPIDAGTKASGGFSRSRQACHRQRPHRELHRGHVTGAEPGPSAAVGGPAEARAWPR